MTIFGRIVFCVFASVAVFGNVRGEDLNLLRVEFAKYYRQIVGKEMPEGLVRFAIDPKVSKLGRDAYRIVTTASGQEQDGRAGSPL
ncbi:MAG: hypothetical protein IKR48_05050, partial [Kiritimatiellae bacterium]|nr:hypothetical protein [Kiritimatiellia bacterium]